MDLAREATEHGGCGGCVRGLAQYRAVGTDDGVRGDDDGVCGDYAGHGAGFGHG